jgi:hypothetical protein
MSWLAAVHSLALVTGGLFAGSGLMEVCVQQPARVAADPAIGLKQMQLVLARADPYMPLLAAISFLLSACLALTEPAMLPYGVAAISFGAIFPFSALAILPVNRGIRTWDLQDAASPTAARLVRTWGRLHAIRSAAGLSGFIALVCSTPW